MKKKIIYYCLIIFIIFLIGSAALFNFHSTKKSVKTKTLERVTLAEVAHTVFYAPMYVSIENNFFDSLIK